jgi:hypothetical protein
MLGPLVSLKRRLNGARTPESHARDSYSAAAAPSCQRCWPATTHAVAASCVFSSRRRYEREACSLLFPQRPSSTHHSTLPLTSPLLHCCHCAAAPQDPLAIAPWAPRCRRVGAPNPGTSQQPARPHELRVTRLPLPSHWLGQAKRFCGLSPLQQYPFLFSFQIIQIQF